MTEDDIKANLRAALDLAKTGGKFAGPAELARLVNKSLQKLFDQGMVHARQTISSQTASNWLRGTVIPDWNFLRALADAIEASEEAILFGAKRDEQLKKEKEYLVRVSEEEVRLLTSYREASKIGQKTIAKQARVVADDHPASEAQVHQLRRKADRADN